MNVNQVLSLGGRRKARKRRGRGEGSGLGKSAGRGNKGAKARSGWRRRYGYEGGQMPIVRRVPKRGFNNVNFATYYDVINVGDLGRLFEDGAAVSLERIVERGILKPRFDRLKVLGGGVLEKKLHVTAHTASGEARRKIEAAGGSLQCLVPPRPVRKPPPKPAPAGKGGEKPAKGGAGAEPDAPAPVSGKKGGGPAPAPSAKKDKAPKPGPGPKGEKSGEAKG